ncbi:hypothetical protein [Planktothrix agardhii]|nr:hypothetical protein [Planktothrix agardhii]
MMFSQSQEQQRSLPNSVDRTEMTRMAVQWAQKYYAKAAANSPRTSNHFLLDHEVDVTEFDQDRSRTVADLMKNLSLLGTLA